MIKSVGLSSMCVMNLRMTLVTGVNVLSCLSHSRNLACFAFKTSSNFAGCITVATFSRFPAYDLCSRHNENISMVHLDFQEKGASPRK